MEYNEGIPAIPTIFQNGLKWRLVRKQPKDLNRFSSISVKLLLKMALGWQKMPLSRGLECLIGVYMTKN